MSDISMFLSLDEDLPLGIFWADSNGCGVVEIDNFVNESMIGMDPTQALRYAEFFRYLSDKLNEYATNED